jgi:hypothetical protein
MVTAVEILPDRYRSGRYLRRWSLVDGYPRCIADALDTATATTEEVDAVEAGNIAVHDAVEAVEAYKAALGLTTGRTAPPALPDLIGFDGNTYTLPNPALDAWNAAQAVIAAVTPETLALAELRKPAVAAPLNPLDLAGLLP